MVDNAMDSSPTRSSALAMRKPRFATKPGKKRHARPAAHAYHVLYGQRKLRLQA